MEKDLEDLAEIDLDTLEQVTGGVGGARPMRDSALAGLASSALAPDLPHAGLAGFHGHSHVADDLRPSLGHDALVAGLAHDATTHHAGIAVCGVVSPQQTSIEDVRVHDPVSRNFR